MNNIQTNKQRGQTGVSVRLRFQLNRPVSVSALGQMGEKNMPVCGKGSTRFVASVLDCWLRCFSHSFQEWTVCVRGRCVCAELGSEGEVGMWRGRSLGIGKSRYWESAIGS